MKVVYFLIAPLLVMVLQLACETEAAPTATSGPSPTPTRTRAQLLTGIPPTLTPTPYPAGSVPSAARTQVIPPMESLSRFTVECLEKRLPTLEAGNMFTPILKALVDCMNPQELADTRRYVPARRRPGTGTGV